MKHDALSQQYKNIIPAVAEVLAWSQKYMREREVRCLLVCLLVISNVAVYRMNAVL